MDKMAKSGFPHPGPQLHPNRHSYVNIALITHPVREFYLLSDAVDTDADAIFVLSNKLQQRTRLPSRIEWFIRQKNEIQLHFTSAKIFGARCLYVCVCIAWKWKTKPYTTMCPVVMAHCRCEVCNRRTAGKFLIKYASWVIGHIKLTTCSLTILMSASKHNYNRTFDRIPVNDSPVLLTSLISLSPISLSIHTLNIYIIFCSHYESPAHRQFVCFYCRWAALNHQHASARPTTGE